MAKETNEKCSCAVIVIVCSARITYDINLVSFSYGKAISALTNLPHTRAYSHKHNRIGILLLPFDVFSQVYTVLNINKCGIRSRIQIENESMGGSI